MSDIMCQEVPSETLDQIVRVYVVLESNPIIAADLIGTLETTFACRVIHAKSLLQLSEELSDTDCIDAAFLELGEEELIQSGLDRFLRSRGAGLILTRGEQPSDGTQPVGATILVRPFTEAMILDALKTARKSAGASPPH
ncbi:hypothetical protein [Roseovarius pelagicus]|uniref:Response regulatory domain-containing protein n=1 Tax=Roseovarius pelagicus TaxID=2980108 RepID=A0ABY6DD85_9RHOB|nr:hypothetical protein [Roseovarius pelagicus]UXX84107.1 hypothetical protein N7U68_05500 [Roseovarius pelagicus]